MAYCYAQVAADPKGQRAQYQLISGTKTMANNGCDVVMAPQAPGSPESPKTGWVSLKANGKESTESSCRWK